MPRTGATFADAAEEWLRYLEHDRARKPSTLSGYRSIVGSELLPRFGERPLEAITTDEIQAWLDSMTQSASTRTKALVICTASSSGRARCGRFQRIPRPMSRSPR